MRLPYWVIRLLHRQKLSRHRLRGTFLHRKFGDRILHKELWSPTREGLARAWLLGWPITVIPFLPGQSIFAVIAALLVRGNLLLCIALQFLSTPFTAPVHLSACYLVGEVVRGANPKHVWREVRDKPSLLLSGHAVTSLYLGSAVIGIIGGALGYAIIRSTWRDKPRRRREADPARPGTPSGSAPPFDDAPAQPSQLRLPLKTDEEKRAEARDGF
ncbi:MAG TPA: DUF2062 domain-containing protein [Opitutaceae bacterium]